MADGASYIAALHRPSALLPIAKHRDAILYAIESNSVTIIVGETGSGKTTQLPQYLEQAGYCNDDKIIAITQPRRVAVTTVAARVAEEEGCPIGQKVGYSIRFEDVTSPETKIKFLTDGLLLREALVDPLLSRYSVIMVDEAHERSISSDVLLGVLKKIHTRRPELKIIVSSATLQAEDFLTFFTVHGTPDDEQPGNHHVRSGQIVSVEGRAFPVDTNFLTEPCEEYVERAVDLVVDIHTSEPKGDILVFLTGQDEINTAREMLADRLPSLPEDLDRLWSLPLYGGLSTEQQMYVFEPAPENHRKVIFATNIAEASVTIDGIKYVIDSGFVKLRSYNPSTSIETLTPRPISKASATQRAGRAGRNKPGKCYRLYTEEAFDSLDDVTVPEIQRSNLASTVLQLKALGYDNIARFDFLTPPPTQLLVRALEVLYSLGGLDDYAKLTKPIGTRMAEMALEPMLATCLLNAQAFGCLSEMLTIAAMSSLEANIWFSHDEKKAEESMRRRFAVEQGDHLTLINVFHAFSRNKDVKWCQKHFLNFKTMTRAVSVRNQLKRHLERFGVDESLASRPDPLLRLEGMASEERIRRCLASGYFPHAARMAADGSFTTVDGGTTLHAHPSSLMFNRKAEWVVFTEVIETGKKIFIRDVTRIEKDWLMEYGRGFYKVKGQ